MDYNGSLWGFITPLCVVLGSNRSVCVLISPYASLWVLISFLGPYAPLWNLIVSNGFCSSFCVFMDFNGSVWILITPYSSLQISVGPYGSL